MPYKNIERQREFQREWAAKRKSEYFKDKICICCGSKLNLELSHKNKNNKISHNIWSWSKIRREAELAKCEIMCSICHRVKTNEERQPSMEHGTYNMTYNLGCRCSECRRYIKLESKRKMDRRRIIGRG